MKSPAGAFRFWLPWLFLGPLFMVSGVVLGRTMDWDRPLWAAGSSAANALPPRSASELTIAPVVDRVSGAVVGIRTNHRALREDGSVAGSAVPFREGNLVSHGTGFVFHAEGLVLTAHHLVEQPVSIEVEIPGHGRYTADLVGEDPSSDLAVLRIVEPPEELPFLQFGDSEAMRPGDFVFTMGNPERFAQSVGFGVVGHSSRHIRAGQLPVSNLLMQFSAFVHHGSSGSPLFSLRGEVVGMTVQRAADVEGIGFAVPSRIIELVLDSISRNQGSARRSVLGVSLGGLSPTLREELGIEPGIGVRITRVRRGSAAEEAGLRRGDVVLRSDGRSIYGANELHTLITWTPPDTELSFEVLRDGEPIEPIHAVLRPLPADDPERSAEEFSK